MIRSDLFDPEIISHGFFTREGGVSTGIYEGLNCGAGSDDSSENVIRNKEQAMEKLGLTGSDLRNLYQIHSTDVVVVDNITDFSQSVKADAMVSKIPGIALGILTADCVPILFADTENKVIGAAHSGWKGSLGGISKNVIDEMIKLGAQRNNIQISVGPSIQQPSYEVGSDFPRPFLEKYAENARFFIPSINEGHFMFDLTGFVSAELEAQQVKSFERLHHDTYQLADQFFSYRRMCHKGEADYGRQLSAISLRF
jgi:purine-nucleoside/S-methyl-5'-thioadenosine phosphorylase / adenosine deaminase